MTEDDEIDILGDFTFENYLSKTNPSIYGNTSHNDILDCDFPIHPQWLLDKPSANPNSWYGSSSEKLTNDDTLVGHVTTQNSIKDESGWTETEKNLLQRGIEIFNKNNTNLSQFIGSKTPAEVKHYLDNYYSDVQATYSGFYEADAKITDAQGNEVVSDVLTDIEIPTSIEEVIESVTTAEPTVQMPPKRKKKVSLSDDLDLKTTTNHVQIDVFSRKIKNNIDIKKRDKSGKDKYEISDTKKRKGYGIPVKHAKFKVIAQLKKLRQKQNMMMKPNTVRKEHEHIDRNKIEIVTGRGLSVPICDGEEVVTIKKDDTDSDIDIEIDIDDDITKPVRKESKKLQENNHQKDIVCSVKNTIKDEETIRNLNRKTLEDTLLTSGIEPSLLSEDIVKKLMSIEKPDVELFINEDNITELERIFNPEYFDVQATKRSSKTPDRYLKIRNFIINTWKTNRPSYVKKTALRQGLKNCGDVNCIGKIHMFLEQIGAINFGCEQVSYIRPLYSMLRSLSKEKVTKEPKIQENYMTTLGSRQRAKKKFNNDGEGGCTLTHNEEGEVIETTFVDEKPVPKKPYTRKPAVQLIACQRFTRDTPQQYKLVLNLSALLPMDFHAHTSLTEVMGLVAGHWDRSTKTLTVSKYEPCLNIASSATHCEMCPISQAKAADAIHNQGYEVLGWFHSHPTFAPEPSQQDLDTQHTLQRSIGHDKPCIGVIVSPFINGSNSVNFRCLIVDRKINQDKIVPYKLQVELKSNGFNVDKFLNEVWKIFTLYMGDFEGEKLDFNKTYFQDSSVTFLEKLIMNIKNHLSLCSDLNKKTCDAITNGIMELFKH